MKTIAVMLGILLGVATFNAQSMNRISFSVEVMVEHHFSPTDLNVTVTNGTVKKGETVLLQKHNEYLRAMKDKQTIIQNTSNQAEIVAFFNNQEIELEDAFAMINDYNNYDKTANMDLKSVPVAEANVPNEFYYAIEIITTDIQSLDEYIKICPELEKQVLQKDERTFVVGKISQHANAVSLQEKFSKAGLKNNIIVAYEGNKQVPVYLVGKR